MFTSEGRVLPAGRAVNPADGVNNRFYRYEYHLKDYLGNLHVACRCAEKSGATSPAEGLVPIVVQEEQYDPWGLSMTGLSNLTVANGSRFKYNNHEEQQGLGWIDLMARQYDPQTGRFTSVDPVTESQELLSMYQYGWNKPILQCGQGN